MSPAPPPHRAGVRDGDPGPAAGPKAVFFDVDFTLIHPGPTFQGIGYQRFCGRYGIEVDPSQFSNAVRSASAILNEQQDHIYDAAIFVRI